MFRVIVVLCLFCSTSSLCNAASDDFRADKPSPLKLVHSPLQEATVFNFYGRIQVSGQFIVAWRAGKHARQILHVAFFPDPDSAARLPRMNLDLPVKELRFSNPAQAVSILLDPSTARNLLAKELLSAEGRAMATIRQYTVFVACDRRWYEAKLVTALRSEKVVMGERDQNSYGCG